MVILGKVRVLFLTVFIFIVMDLYSVGAIDNKFSPVCIILNDEVYHYENIYPDLIGEALYIPLRNICEKLGIDLAIDSVNNVVLISKNDKFINVDVKNKKIIDSQGREYTVNMYTKNGRLMFPIKIFCDNLGYDLTEKNQVYRMKDENNLFTDEEMLNLFADKINSEKYSMNMGKNDNNQKVMYLSFDDGPSIYTDEILKILKNNDSYASFFMLSNNIVKYSNAVNEIIKNGNTVGLHGVSHKVSEIYKSPQNLANEMLRANDALYQVSGVKTNLIRVPYGSKPYMTKDFRDAYVRYGFKMWDWNVDSKDSLKNEVAVDVIVNNVKYQVEKKRGPVILLHERKNTVIALPQIIAYLRDKGYTLKSINYNSKPINFWQDTR